MFPQELKELSQKKKSDIKFFVYFGTKDRIETIKYLVKNGIDYEPIVMDDDIYSEESFIKKKELDLFVFQYKNFEPSFSPKAVPIAKIKKSRRKINKSFNFLTMDDLSDIIMKTKKLEEIIEAIKAESGDNK